VLPAGHPDLLPVGSVQPGVVPHNRPGREGPACLGRADRWALILAHQASLQPCATPLEVGSVSHKPNPERDLSGVPRPGPGRSSRPINGSTYGTDVVVRSVVNRLWCSAESTAWPTVTWTVLILRPRRRSPRSCARLARCPGALTSSAVPPQRWMTPRPSSSRLRPAPAWSSSCTTSRCLNGSCSEARRRQFVEILSRRIAIDVWLGPCCVKRFSKKMWPRMSRPAWRLRPRGRCGTGGVDVFRTCAIPLERSP
jgi:hypothetical protein